MLQQRKFRKNTAIYDNKNKILYTIKQNKIQFSQKKRIALRVIAHVWICVFGQLQNLCCGV